MCFSRWGRVMVSQLHPHEHNSCLTARLWNQIYFPFWEYDIGGCWGLHVQEITYVHVQVSVWHCCWHKHPLTNTEKMPIPQWSNASVFSCSLCCSNDTSKSVVAFLSSLSKQRITYLCLRGNQISAGQRDLSHSWTQRWILSPTLLITDKNNKQQQPFWNKRADWCTFHLIFFLCVSYELRQALKKTGYHWQQRDRHDTILHHWAFLKCLKFWLQWNWNRNVTLDIHSQIKSRIHQLLPKYDFYSVPASHRVIFSPTQLLFMTRTHRRWLTLQPLLVQTNHSITVDDNNVTSSDATGW